MRHSGDVLDDDEFSEEAHAAEEEMDEEDAGIEEEELIKRAKDLSVEVDVPQEDCGSEADDADDSRGSSNSSSDAECPTSPTGFLPPARRSSPSRRRRFVARTVLHRLSSKEA